MLNVKLMERRGGNFSLITVFADRSSLEWIIGVGHANL
jgi:hypothetical protein